MQVLTSLSGLPISAQSAAFAPTNSADVSAIASAYVESAVSGKQDSLTFAYNADSAISSINGSALAGQGGGGGGSVVSPNGTILVTDGSSIDATNSAIGSSTVEQKFLNYAPYASQISNWQTTTLLQGESVSGADLMKLQALANHYTLTASAVYSAIISGLPIGGGGELVGSASATAYGSSMEFNFPLDHSWGFGSIWASSQYYNIYLNTADNNAIAFYSASTSSGVKELAWKDDIPSAVNIGVYEDTYHNKYVSSIDGIPVSAKRAGSAASADYAYTAVWDKNGRYLSALADKTSIPSGVTSPNGTIIANGFNVEATNSAVSTTVVPGYATMVVGNSGQLNPSTAIVCTLPTANENSKLFFQMDYGSVMDVSAVYDGITATALAGTGYADVVLDVPNATTVSLYGSDYRNMHGSASASAADYLAPGSIGELAWASALPTYSYDAEDKISGINGSAIAGGAGGVDSATVSAIASSYAESAASGKLDASASSSFYTTANESGFLTGVDLSPYQTTADMSGYMPTSLSSDFQQVTGMSSYALSSDVSATVDLVGTQSANWGGSALQLSAGPGVKLEKSGNVLVASTDETVLWSGEKTSLSSITLSESYTNFDRVRFYWKPWSDEVAWRVSEIPSFALVFTLDAGWASNGGPNAGKALFVYSISSNGTNFSQIQGNFQNITGGSWASSVYCTVNKVVGVSRTAGF